jgi:hypothetical protein
VSYNYSQFVTDLANMLGILSTSGPFQTVLPNIIDDAEQRAYRDLDLLDTRIVDTTGNLTANSRSFTLPTSVGRFVVVEQANVITPAGLTLATGGVRNPLMPASRDLLDAFWPSEVAASVPSVPEFFAMLTSQIIRLGPAPDATYQMEVQGTARPAPLSNSNQNTMLSLYLPDLFFAAAMYFASGYSRNFGAQADDPRQAQSWENTYQARLKSAVVEEFRRKFSGSAWSPEATPPEAQPARS